MATCIYCDACGTLLADRVNRFTYKCHLESETHGYADHVGNAISGRSVTADLCNACYNEIVGVAVKKMREVQGTNPTEDEIGGLCTFGNSQTNTCGNPLPCTEHDSPVCECCGNTVSES